MSYLIFLLFRLPFPQGRNNGCGRWGLKGGGGVLIFSLNLIENNKKKK